MFKLTLFLLFVTSAAACKRKCPAVDGPDAVLFPDPWSCSRFYICSNGIPRRQNCPAGLEFNPRLRVCDWPDKAGCRKCPRDLRVRCPPKDGADAVLLPNPYNCSSFYICSNGVPIRQNCSVGLEFNSRLRVCDWPRNADCWECPRTDEEISYFNHEIEDISA